MDWIRRYARLLRIRSAARRRPPLAFSDVSVVHDRVWWSDIDELRHMNNGVYLSLLDHARLDLMLRSGGWQAFRAAKVYPVVTAQTIAYRRSLELGQRFEIQTRILGYDARSVYIEQRVVREGEIYSRAIVAGRFLRDAGGVVPIEEVGALVGVDVARHPVPAWVVDWAANVRLPSTRDPAPSDWA
jgi:YbgC/YbaW family acyl-CoA thioester hydrolase